MVDGPQLQAHSEQGTRLWRRRWSQFAVTVCLLAGIGFVLAAEYILHNAEPILRKRIIETLSDRFDAPVELDRVTISLVKGVQVQATGLRIPFLPAGQSAPSYPLLAVNRFSFRTSLRSLLHQPMHVADVEVEGIELHIPPPSQRKGLFGTRDGQHAADLDDPRIRAKIAITVQELHCSEVKLFIESGKPGKDPLLFHISTLDLRDVGRDRAMLYDAQLTNPRPQGLLHATGHFGPWAGNMPPGQTPDPGQTPLDGAYTFDHADLHTIRGIGGTLSSTGRFSGVLDRLVVDGRADVPNFSLDISDHPVPLQTLFHAIVDGTNGDTYLEPVHARLANSEFTTSGKVVKVKGDGHDIQLNVDIPHGRMQDFLRLAVKTDPPLMDGMLAMHTRLHIPPGRERVPLKMEMIGSFTLQSVHFNNVRWQDRLDGLSARAQGHPQDVSEVSSDREAEASSRMAAAFTLAHGLLTVNSMQYALPGAQVLLSGVYSTDGKLFEFKGHVRTEATASQMMTGWKSWALKPVDRFFQKNGAGLEVPVEISGTQGDLHFGLALHGTEDTPAQMLADIRDKDHRQHEMQDARSEAKEADREDAAAARAKTLEEAEALHLAAVHHRSEAQTRAQAAQTGSH